MQDKQKIASFEDKESGILAEVEIRAGGYMVVATDTDVEKSFGMKFFPFGMMDEAIREARNIATGKPS